MATDEKAGYRAQPGSSMIKRPKKHPDAACGNCRHGGLFLVREGVGPQQPATTRRCAKHDLNVHINFCCLRWERA